MHTQTIEYFDGAEKLIGELINYDQAKKNQPIIMVFHAFEGRSEFTIDYANKIAAKGYAVFVADMYGNAKTANTIEGCFDLIKPFLQDRQLVRRRALLAYKTAAEYSQTIGAIGFCFGGMCVLEIARSGESLRAGVSAHGVLAKSDLPTHPIKSSLLILHGYQDPQVPPTEFMKFAAEMEAADTADWTFTFFGDAMHSFTDPKTGTFDPAREPQMGRVYNATAANRTFRNAIDFFDEILKA
jgi:dienelactone hydrolase